jgi:hypothetical protein
LGQGVWRLLTWVVRSYVLHFELTCGFFLGAVDWNLIAGQGAFEWQVLSNQKIENITLSEKNMFLTYYIGYQMIAFEKYHENITNLPRAFFNIYAMFV